MILTRGCLGTYLCRGNHRPLNLLLSAAYGLPLTDVPFGPVTFAASFPFSPTTTSNSTTSPSPTLRTIFFGLFFLIAVYIEK